MKWLLVLLIIASNSCGDLLNTAGMRRFGEVRELRPVALMHVVAGLARNKLVLGGLFCMAVAFFSLMALLSIASLSFAVPATGGSYVVETFLARHFLHEKVSSRRWIGAVLVTCGVILMTF
jgi:drug/metabolite transporter (DMT)-like permease